MAIQGCAAKLSTRPKTRSGQLETDCRILRRAASHIPSAGRSTSAELHQIWIWTVQRYNIGATSHKQTIKAINHSAPILTKTPA
ncbi:uncharacterized protein FMAN_04252 [Fusarium mangiferae]|uniref:Uncharacterized protein n=1 Tax=Fusarium mangiferae TaxID=192010 RepID=A0A1L7SYH3_FUSMA|nr:uncharacterized protein FMAN_04252 [Fusarium mangiferae]CVK89542.1 uncharacterized protein FMAN_04252 [Fusarium mangiferae]